LKPGYLLWVGHFEDRKDPALALRIREAEVRAGRNMDRPLVMVGNGPLAIKDSVHHLSAQFEGARVAIAIEGCDDQVLGALYRGASATLVTSTKEGFSMVPLEALSCGSPVVASDLPAHRELLVDRAILVPNRTAEAWLVALSQVEGKRQRTISKEVARLLTGFRWECAAQAFAIDVLGLQLKSSLPR
jgi:glycosyltransferase involved in cell wall biosynthesis